MSEQQVVTRSANWSEPSSHLDGGAGLYEQGGANQVSAYCKGLLMRGREELSFEELRTERLNLRQQQQLDEKLRQLTEVKEQLSEELEYKKRLLLLKKSQQAVPEAQIRDSAGPPAASSFQIYDESQSAAARPAGNSETSQNELVDDVFLGPDERGLCLRVTCPPPGGVVVSELSQQTDSVNQNQGLSPAPQHFSHTAADHHGGAAEDLQTLVESCPPNVSQKPATKTRDKLSPIQETSVEANPLSAGECSPLQEDQENLQNQEDQENQALSPVVDPCDPDVRWRLLDLCDVTSSPDLCSESRPLPVVEEHSCLQLGGDVIHIYSRVLEGPGFSVFKGATEDGYVVLKVDGCSAPWDFHQSLRLKNSSTAAGFPLISCFLFLDGCITVYTTPPGHMFTELTECVPSEASVGYKAVALVTMVSQLHSCRLLHAALQPHLLTCCHRGLLIPDWVFPVDWSSSVDLDLQRDVTSVQQVPSAQDYIGLGLLEPTAPPQLVDLVGLAETVHLLLTNSKMVLKKEGGVWRAEQFSGEEPCDMFSRMWRRFFCSLLNAEGRSSSSILSELKDQLTTLYC
ncbi:mitotic checkpoint serine/threonine-protein kinase BUB1 beta-like isoform X1 [Anoplopoma fimbria]|uniref:mitotic checkpoint serine/threonine-protein kinase BUB1 beta-like isoform X1 n=1 Tax=Anoplopoma fimbria TaxID=229290 RepID=UPI0023EC458A|nr:mitotic checkpoint serine/threonine-protein kinase BUB1 beta-like isoform X1 [Anoplopoma fimbria]